MKILDTPNPWIAHRTQAFDSSGIRKVFELARTLRNPINLSIGQPDFAVPPAVKDAAIDAIRTDKNGYALTQGMPVLLERLQDRVDGEYPRAGRRAFVSSGTSGALVLAMLALVNPGDEVIIFDPFFVMYKPLLELVAGRAVLVDTYPDFRIDLDRVRGALSPKTKAIILNSPANPTGVVATEGEVRGLADLAAERNVCLVSDEIYRSFCYDAPFVSPARYNDQVLVIDGFSKSHAMTGWRVGFAHGPPAVIDTMIKLQQYSFVCAPQPFQWAAASALDVDVAEHRDAYRRKRDTIVKGLAGYYDVATPGGAFYLFPRVPKGTASDFCTRAIEHELLIIPGNIFSHRDTHFRISYAASDETIARGIEVLRKISE
jgi:aspartate aminotransferase/aminotransferase